jgi:hypothetical protein
MSYGKESNLIVFSGATPEWAFCNSYDTYQASTIDKLDEPASEVQKIMPQAKTAENAQSFVMEKTKTAMLTQRRTHNFQSTLSARK